MKQVTLSVLAAVCVGLMARAAIGQEGAAQGAADPAAAARAQEGRQGDAAEASETPAGKALAKFLDMVNSNAEIDIARWFSPAFLEHVPAEKLKPNLEQLRAALGGLRLKGVAANGARSVVATAEAVKDGSPWRVWLDVDEGEPALITGLRFQPAPDLGVKPVKTWDDAKAAIEGLGQARSLAVYEVALDGTRTALFGMNEGEALPIGSAFKLFVLGALAERIEKGGPGAPTWEEELAIDDRWKSLPGGTMQNLAAGTKLSVFDFAKAMISRSDNTATDHLMARVGRERVEDYYKARVSADSAKWTLPFLTTREMFAVKLGDAERFARYAAGDVASRTAMLVGDEEAGIEGLEGEAPSLQRAAAWTAPREVRRVEWFATTEELCAQMVELWRMSHRPGLTQVADALGVNRGLPLDEELWPYVLFKGGSEVGVINLTWLIERAHDGKRDVPSKYVLSLSVVDEGKPVDERTAVGVMGRVMEMLAER